MMRRFLSSLMLLFALVIALISPVSKADEQGDQDLQAINVLYQSLLNDYSRSGEKNDLPLRLVDYAALKSDPRLDDLVAQFERYPRERLQTREQKIAFYLNAYNVLAIQKVVENWPLDKLKSLGNFIRPVWTHPAGKVCGEAMTLRKLEHEILRQLGDPRVHFALNCASVSCPDLRIEPYVAERIDQQLAEQTQLFLSQEGKGMLVEGELVTLSPLFDWFEEDFDVAGGVRAFVERYAGDRLPADGEWRIEGYFRYDWGVNAHLSGSEMSRIRRGSVTWFN